MYNNLLWHIPIFSLATLLFVKFFHALLFSLPSTLSSGLKSFDLYHRKVVERRPLSITGILACWPVYHKKHLEFIKSSK